MYSAYMALKSMQVIFVRLTAFITIYHVQLLMPPCMNLPYQTFNFKTIVLWISATGKKNQNKLILTGLPPDTKH